MEPKKFDDLAKHLSTVKSSRRSLLGNVSATLAAITAAFAVDKPVAAACRPVSTICAKNGDCCSAYCGPMDNTGRRRCECGNRQTDPNNCGTCGHVCGSGESCCSGSCTNLQTNGLNCGTCGTICTSPQTCNGGVCLCPDPLESNCSGTCANLQTDGSNCGACGTSCTSPETCMEGVCSCPAGTMLCTVSGSPTCRYPDEATCSSNIDCCSDVCVNEICEAGLVALGGTCDESADCVAGATCSNGICCTATSASCTANSDCCSGICVSWMCVGDLVSRGGTCDESADCVAGATCSNGVCCMEASATCTANSDCCSGACQNDACCNPNNTNCSSDGDCCSGRCSNGVCDPLGPGEGCDDDRDCDTASVCANGNCCRAATAACSSSADCCSGGCFDDKCTDAIAVVDVTSIPDCEIEFIEYADEEQTTIISTTGSQMCGPGSVIHSFAMTQVSAAEESGYQHVVLTGDASIDEVAIDGLIDALLPVDEDPGGGEDEGEVSANATCVSGTYPAYYVTRGSYLTYKSDGGPVDVKIRWELFFLQESELHPVRDQLRAPVFGYGNEPAARHLLGVREVQQAVKQIRCRMPRHRCDLHKAPRLWRIKCSNPLSEELVLATRQHI